MPNVQGVKFQRVDALKELRAHLVRYLSRGAEVVSDSARVQALTGLTEAELDRVCSVHFLASPTASHAVANLPDLLRRLPSTAAVAQRETRGHIQGQVNWAATVQHRLKSNDPAVFVCSEPERRYDTPQAQLLKATIENLHNAARRTSWLARNPFQATAHTSARPGSTISHVLSIASTVEPLRDDRKLRGVSGVHLKPSMLEALRSREGLRPLCDAYDLYNRLVVARERSALAEAVSDRYFAPNADRVFELLVAFRLARRLENHGWVQEPVSGLLGARTPVAIMQKEARTLRIFWQTSVWDTETASLNKVTAGALHRIAKGAHSRIQRYRPDVLVEILEADGTRVLMIGEVKLTAVAGSAAEARGVLECLGYLRDAQVLQEAGVPLRGFVVAWNASGRPAPGLVAISDQDHLDNLASIIASS